MTAQREFCDLFNCKFVHDTEMVPQLFKRPYYYLYVTVIIQIVQQLKLDLTAAAQYEDVAIALIGDVLSGLHLNAGQVDELLEKLAYYLKLGEYSTKLLEVTG
ncbi:unnamed protein product [Dicrocoelium dendriticum]|nr:unnamed protein product [Dicrocoelium dendriticum]